MSKQYDVDDILNEIKAKKARQNASQSARAGRGSPATRPKPVNQTSRTFPPKHTGSLNRSL